MQQGREPHALVGARHLLAQHGFYQQRVLRHRENMRAVSLSVPARHTREPVGDICHFDIERRGIEQIEPPAREHALPGAGGNIAGKSLVEFRFGHRFLFFGLVSLLGFEARLAFQACACLVAEAGHEMIVDHAGGLHEGIDNGGPHEFESARLQVLGYPGR